MENGFKGLRCPKCNLKHNYIRIKTQDMVCQSCSAVSTEKEWREYNLQDIAKVESKPCSTH